MKCGTFNVRAVKSIDGSTRYSLCRTVNIRQYRTGESTLADFCYAAADDDGVDGITFTESISADFCHAVGDGDGGQAVAVLVFVYNCVSMSSKVNGRKVTRKYMRIAEKIKI